MSGEEIPKRRREDGSFLGRMRPFEWISVALLVIGGLTTLNKMDARLARLEEIATVQSQTNVKMEQAMKEGAAELRSDIREIANTVRRIDSRGRGG